MTNKLLHESNLTVLQQFKAAVSVWFEIWEVIDLGLKTGGLWDLEVQQMEGLEAHSA